MCTINYLGSETKESKWKICLFLLSTNQKSLVKSLTV